MELVAVRADAAVGDVDHLPGAVAERRRGGDGAEVVIPGALISAAFLGGPPGSA